MKLKKLKPVTPGTRHQLRLEKSQLSNCSYISKNLIKNKHRFMGRSSLNGRITSWHRGAGCKKKARILDFENNNKISVVIGISYDPGRTAFISTNFDFLTKTFFLTSVPNFVYPGFIYSCGKNFKDLKLGFRTSINRIPSGSVISNLSLSKLNKAKYCRSAGTQAQIIQKSELISKIKLSSGKIINVLNTGYATLGVNSNIKSNLVQLGKAGINRLKGFRPIVRGIAMNPVDHPHGGRTNSGFVKVTPWGIPTKSKLKRKNK
jgi:large subunit ribosomal protein L2